MVKNLPALWETRVQSLGLEDTLEKGMDTHSSIIAWRIPWLEEPGRLQSMELQRVGYDWMANTNYREISFLRHSPVTTFSHCTPPPATHTYINTTRGHLPIIYYEGKCTLIIYKCICMLIMYFYLLSLQQLTLYWAYNRSPLNGEVLNV